METYKTKVATNDKVEMIHVSQDEELEDAVEWAKSLSFPWPTVLSDKIVTAKLDDFSGGAVPYYGLFDKEGKLIVSGKEEAFAKIAELNK